MHVLAGPNGAGKTTLYETTIQPKTKVPFINADDIQKNELKDPAMKVSHDAAKIAAKRREQHIKEKKSFVTETVFSHPSKLKLIDTAKNAGFRVVIYHVSVSSANLSVDRVFRRVKKGGHDVPEQKIRERYDRNQVLIKKAVVKVDAGVVFDNSIPYSPPKLVMSFKEGRVNKVIENIPEWVKSLYKDQLKPFSIARQKDAARSYSDIKSVAESIGGGSKTFISDRSNRNHKGVIVGESTLHLLQSTKKEKEFVVHFKPNLKNIPKITQEVEINYTSKNKASVKPVKQSELKPEEKLSLYDKSLKARGVPKGTREKIQLKAKSKIKNLD